MSKQKVYKAKKKAMASASVDQKESYRRIRDYV